MSPMTCSEVEVRLELYAAGECEPAEVESIGGHLAVCPRCAANCAEARQLVGLLELRLQEPERLRRLAARVAAEETPRLRVLPFAPTWRRAAALAAMLLLTVGLATWLMPRFGREDGDAELAISLRKDNGKSVAAMKATPGRMAARETPSQYREQLKEAAATGRYPQPPTANLAIEVRNVTDQDLRLLVAGPNTQVHLDLRGPGAVIVPIKEDIGLPPRMVTLKPGQRYVIRIERLTDGRRAWYWTEPGEYTLTARFATLASSPGRGERQITTCSAPVRIHVEEK